MARLSGESVTAHVANRAANRIHAQAAASPEGESLQSFIDDHVGEETVICLASGARGA